MTDSDVDLSCVSPVRASHLLTTDLHIAELISERSIATHEGHRLVLGSDAARGVLSWYRSARSTLEAFFDEWVYTAAFMLGLKSPHPKA